MQRYSAASLILVAIALGMGIWAALRLPIGSAGVHAWLPLNRPERQRYESFLQRFGSDQVVLVSWPGCAVDDPRLPRYVRELDSSPEFAELFLGVESTDRVFRQLRSRPLRLSERECERRLRGLFLGPNGTAMVLTRVSPAGVTRQRETIRHLKQIGDKVDGLGAGQLRLVGTVFESEAIDAAAERSLTTLVLPSTVLGFLTTVYCLGNFRSAILVLILAGVGQLIAVSLVYYSGQQFSAVLIVLPTLIFMLTLSGAVHLANYYWEVPADTGRQSRGLQTLFLGWKPCALSSMTTMLGMGSLILSQLLPVRQFGFFSALGLGLATILLLLAFPCFADGMNSHWFGSAKKPAKRRLQFPRRELSVYLAFQGRSAVWIAGASIFLLLATFPGLYRLQASTKFCDMFSPRSQIVSDMRWFEQEVGPIAGAEVLLRIDSKGSLPPLEQAAIVRKVAGDLGHDPEIGGVLSVISFLPNWSETQSARSLATRTLISQRLEEDLESFQTAGFVKRENGANIWRVHTKVSATSRKSYGELSQHIAAQVRNTLQQNHWDHVVQAEVTGLSPIMHETQVTLLTDLLNSFLSAFLLITPVMMWMARSFWGGLILMLPNVLPVSLVFGLFGWLGWSLDVAGILTASIALGIAVDDTLHFVNWYGRELSTGQGKLAAIRNTFESCATAMCHTTFISCVTMLPFLCSDFVPTQRFAGMMIAMLSSALFCDLFVLPALLLSPLGRFVNQSPDPVKPLGGGRPA